MNDEHEIERILKDLALAVSDSMYFEINDTHARVLQNYIEKLQNNWNELKNWLKINKYSMTCQMFVAEELLEKMQELEGNNEAGN